jgi:hypothetical protein
VSFDNPLSPYKSHDLTVRDVQSVTGATLAQTVLPVQTTVTDPGAIVQGTVYGPDGQPVPFARVELFQTEYFAYAISNCRRHRTALVRAGADGRFELDYVRQTRCSDLFEIRGSDPTSGHHGAAQGRVRFIGQVMELDVLMLGRGTVRGRVTYEDGTVPEDLQVVGYSPVFFQGSEASYGPDGSYEIRDLPVGTISLGASDRIGSFVYQTVELPRAGAVVERNLTIIRRPAHEPTGDVLGTVYATDGTTPVLDAYLSLYVDGELVGVERSAADGSFDFGTVRAGLAELEAFEGSTGLSGAQLFFDVQPDQVNDITVLLRDERGTVEGHVFRRTLSTVTPVANAVVWVSGTPFNTVTDEAGYYRLEGVFAGNRTVLAADLERQVQVSDSVTINGAGQTVVRDLYFVESVGSGLAGEVLGFTGNPVPGATVHLAAGDQWYAEAVTDLSGRFIFPGLRPGTYELHAFAGANGAVQRATIRFEGETPFVRLQFKRGTIRGTTRSLDGSGQLLGVRSLVTYRTTVVLGTGLVGLDYEAHTLETDGDGSFEIPNALAGRYQLTVTNAFHGEKTVRDEIVYDGEVRQHDFLFEPNGQIRGVVLDWDGETPVAGATVHLRHPSFSEYDLTTDAEGRFTFELVPPYYRRFPIDAQIERNGVFRQARIWVAFTKNGQELDVEVVLPMQGTVSGWVEDANGAAVPGAVVTLREYSYPSRQLVHNADSQGNFSFTNIFAGPVALSAQAPALGGLGGRDTVEIIEEAQEVFSVIVLEATGELEGRVFSPETGELAPTAQVTLDRWNRFAFDSVTSSEGEFRFRLLPLNLYRVRVFDPSTGRFGQSDWVSVDANGQVVTVDVTLEARGDVDGHLYEPESGLGIPGATIRLQTRSLRSFSTYSSTDVDGYFEFQGIPEGSFTLDTKEPEGRRLASGSGEILEEDQRVTVDLYLEAVGVVVGSVLNPVGQPEGLFANSNALIYESGQVVGATLENPFTFDGILTGRSLEIRAYENGGSHRGLAKGKLAAGESELTLDVRMVPLGSAAVTVEDGFGAPIAGADVKVQNGGFYGTKYFAASTGSDGRATFQGLGAGYVSVSASRPGTVLKGSANGQLTLDGEQVEILLRLESSGSIAGRAVLSDGLTPAADALVVVTVGSRTLQALADGNGDFLFPSVPLGSHKVFVQEHFGPGTIERSGSIAANGEAIAMGTLILDDRDPAVVSIDPATGSADLPLGTVVTIRFSEPVDPTRWSGGWITFRKVASSGVASTPSWTEGDTVLTLTPNSPLASFTAYEVIVQSAYDLAGRRLYDKARTTFNTVDVVPPTVVDFLPREGQNQVRVDASILVTFSEPVAFDSLSGGAFQLTELATGAGVTTTFQHLVGERQVLLTPANGLQSDRQYRLAVQGVMDNSGNTMTAPVTTTFWTVDLAPPEILSVDFPAGTSFVAGDDVPVVVTATDDWGVVSAGLHIEDWSWSDTAEPWELTGVAPIVETPTTVTVQITATDAHGNVASVDREIDVAPNPNAVVPVVTDGCGRDGGYVVPGYTVELGPAATDDQAIESLALFIDGEEIGRTSPVNAMSGSASFLWTPPAGTAPGTSYLVRFEARDFAGNVGQAEITIQSPPASARILEAGTTLFPSQYEGEDLVLAKGTYLASEPLSLPSLTVARSARIVAAIGGNEPIDLEIAGFLDVQCGGMINASLGGFPRVIGNDLPGQGPSWVEQARKAGGGSHGGIGAASRSSDSSPGEVYGSVFEPSLGGASGSARGTGTGLWGGAGGGMVDIVAGSLEIDGDVLSRGESQPEYGGSGAGGSILVRTDSLTGVGRIDASGGDDDGISSSSSSWYAEGAGGGGRIAVYATTLSSWFDPLDQLRALGGRRLTTWLKPPLLEGYAAPGTILVKTSGDSHGRLIVDPGVAEDGSHRKGAPTELPALGSGSVISFEATGADAWVGAESPFRPRWVGAWMVLRDAAGGEVGAFRVAALDPVGRAFLEGAGVVAGAASYSGEWRFDGIDLLHGAGLRASDPVAGTDLVFDGEVGTVGDIVAETVVVKSGAVVRPAVGGSLKFMVSGTMTVEAGARIDVTGLGYLGGRGTGGVMPGTAPEGLVASTGDTGGSHGGVGALGGYSLTGGGVTGEVYDSVYQPHMLGGGGATDYTSGTYRGGDGGGVIEIEAGAVVLEGELLARGESRYDQGGGGAGGSVSVKAGSLTGTGAIDASGGDGRPANNVTVDGAGGGGRVSLHVDALASFDPMTQVRAWGGARVYMLSEPDQIVGYGAPGTILVKTPQETYGRLIVDSGEEPDGTDREGPATELPTLGSGAIAAFEAAGADAWVTAGTSFRPRWRGAWMVLLDASGGELGAFRVAALDEAGRALLDGSGAVAGPASYRGEYRFDRIDTLHGAGIEASDPLSGSTLVFEGESEAAAEVSAQSVIVRTGAVVRPATGGSLRFEVSGTMTVEAGARIDVTGGGYPGGAGSSSVAGGAPAGVEGAIKDGGGSHGGAGAKGHETGTVPGEVFDSVYLPRLGGGGGGTSVGGAYAGGAGGGVLEIEAGELVLDGELRAKGAASTYLTGAGGGGSVVVRAGSLSGGGSIDASGGDLISTGTTGGSGGGGRVALWVDGLNGFDPAAQVRTWGGVRVYTTPEPDQIKGYGAPGTVLIKSFGSTYGDLRVDQGGSTAFTIPTTLLPAIGKGIVGATAVDGFDPSDMWIEDQDPAKLFSLGVVGMWVRIGGADYAVLDQSLDRRQLLLEGAAGAVSVGDAYVGIYKFDTVAVAGGAHLELRDGDEVGAWVVEPGSTLTRFDLEPPAVTVTSPAAGTLFVAGDMVSIAAEATDPSGVVSVTFRLGDQSFVDQAAPFAWSAAAPVVEVEQDVPITIEALDGNDNLASVSHLIRVRPVAPGDPPVVTIGCPTPGARLAPGTGLAFAITATHDDGVERVELLVGDDPTPVATDFSAPYDFQYSVPLDAVESEIVNLHFRARSLGGVYGEAVYPVAVIAANVVTADAFLASTDTSLDGSSVVVAAGTLTIEGAHTFRDLVVLSGAAVTHPASTAAATERLDLDLTRDLFVACGGKLDADGKGFPSGVTFRSPGTEAFYFTDDFNDGNIAGWQKVDEGEGGGPSNWSVSGGILQQTTNILSNARVGFGTSLVWPGPLAPTDYRYSAFLRSTDDDWLGLLFRYADAGNMYRFVWTRQFGLRFLEKVVDGQRITLAQDSVAYATGAWYLVEVVADGPRLEVWIDGQRIFDVEDATHPAGSVGVFCYGNAGSYFEDILVAPVESPSSYAGASHGGRGGAADGSNLIYGSLFDPRDPGAGGGGLTAAPGGGVVCIAAAGDAVVDGAITARGGTSINLRPSSAAGSVRLDAAALRGLGSIDASGGAGLSRPAAGGGGRIALYGATIDEGLLTRTLAAGGNADTPERRGAAGTVFVKRDSQPFGDLILDNAGLDSTQPTELLAVGSGVVDGVALSYVTDDDADFIHDLTGIEVFFNGDTTALWPITGHDHHGQTLQLDTSTDALTALVGDTYEGLYRFDRVIVRGGAEAITRSRVQSASPPEIDASSSWVSDYQPAVTLTSPVAGQAFISGSTVSVAATVDDLFGVVEVRLELGDETSIDSAAPYSASFVAPQVAAPTDLTVAVAARDRSGHEIRATRTVRIDPNTDPFAPIVTLADCPRSGDLVVPGQSLNLGFTVADNELVESFRVLVDGEVVQEETAVSQPSASASFVWTPPAGSQPGTSFVIRVEGRDYAGNLGSAEWHLSVPGGAILLSNQTLDSGLDGQDLVLGAGTYTVVGPFSPQTLTLAAGALVVAPVGQDLRLVVGTDLRVECGAALDASGLGYAGGNGTHPLGYAPDGLVGAGREHGGSHGGTGAVWNPAQTTDPPGEVYDSVYRPRLAGGGAGRDGDGSGDGGRGGGVLEIVAASVRLDGEIRADGQSSNDIGRGGGAGGTVLIEAGSMAGAGRISADGGYLRACLASRGVGTGGGGRVALRVGNLAGFDVASQVQAWGAALYDCSWGVYRYARPGTIHVREATSLYGNLIVDTGEEADGTDRDENTIDGMVTTLPALGSGTVFAFEAAGTEAWITGPVAFRERWLGAWMVLEDATGGELGAFEVLELDGAGRALLSGASSGVSAAGYRGEYRFDELVLRHGAGLATSDRLEAGWVRVEGDSRLPARLDVRFDMTVVAGAQFTLAQGGLLDLEVSGTLTLEAGAKLDVSGRGYAGGTGAHPMGYAPEGVLGAGVEHGGSHGGLGEVWNPSQAGSALPGEVYDSVYGPSMAGGGGARDGDGSGDGAAGGGVVEIVAGAVVLEGEIHADGLASNDTNRGGGAGGTVSIEAGSLAGAGRITADGGWLRACHSTRGSGTGSGGRVALMVDDLDAFDVATQVQAWGGVLYDCSWGVIRCASVGTIYARTLESTHGDLWAVRQAICTPPSYSGTTQLPAIVTGTVGVADLDAADPADLWIEPQDPAALFDLGVTGMWVRVEGSDYRVLDQSADRRRLLLEGAAGLIGIGDAYQGVYKLDTVTVRGGAVLEFLDTADVGTFDVDADSQVITPQ